MATPDLDRAATLAAQLFDALPSAGGPACTISSVDDQSAHSMISDDVGVVAIGRNEGERLISCLASVKSNTDNIVYVDSGSTDGSIARAQQIGAYAVTLDLTKPFSAARARNEGFAALKILKPDIRYVQFIDGDCILVQGWLNKALTFLEQRTDVGIACGRRREQHLTDSIYNQLCDFEWDTPLGEAPDCGGDALVRVEAFETVGGFRSQLIAGEEPELCVRLRNLGWKVWRLDAEMTRHDAAMKRFAQWWVRSVRTGYGSAEVSRLHRTSPLRIGTQELARAVGWAGIVPLAIGIGALIHPAVLWAALIYVLQICRIAFRLGPTSFKHWKFALLLTLSKFAEFQGVTKYYYGHWRGQTGALIEYK